MKALLSWIDDRTGLTAGLRRSLDRPLPGRPGWRKVWPGAIALTFCLQLITGFFLWIYYSPSAQTAWESVYFLQYEVLGGWLLRAVHHYSGQILLVLIGLYLIQMILWGTYRAPGELVFWVVVLMGLLTLGLLLSGDLLAWDQNSYSSTKVRVSFLALLPGIGGGLQKLAVGGPAFGHLTLTRFLALHVGLLTGGLLLLLILHGWLIRRAETAEIANEVALHSADKAKLSRYWPYQALRDTVAGLLVLGVIFLLALRHGLSGDQAGVALGSPADPASSYTAARPEWAFLGLYQFSSFFPGELKILPIFIIPGLLLLVVLAMPWIARYRRGHTLNISLMTLLLVGTIALSLMPVWKDRHDPGYQAGLAEERQLADRVKQLARAEGIPAGGALTLLREDPKTQGPKLCRRLCGSCHNYSPPKGEAIITENPAAAELYGFGSRPWLAGFMDPEQIGGPRYFGNTRFAAGVMVRYVEGRFSELKAEEREAIIAALSAEAQLFSQQRADREERELIDRGRELLASRECTRCHRYRGQWPGRLARDGQATNAPDLTGYGSRQWIVGILADPTHPGLYGERNDRMPAYFEFPDKPADNLLAARDLGILTDWLRGDWYEPEGGQRRGASGERRGASGEGRGASGEGRGASGASTLRSSLVALRPSVAILVSRWQSRRPKEVAAAVSGPHAEARRLFQREHCSLCHNFTGGEGGEIIAADPSAPDLGGYASRPWIRGLLDPKQIKTAKYFGNSKLRRGEMANFVTEMFSDMEDEDREDLRKVVIALSAEARLPSQRELDQQDAAVIEEGRAMLGDVFGCTDCHRFHGEGGNDAPDLTGYGSPEWLAAVISDPAHQRFYGENNDGMPSYLAFPDQPDRNLLAPDQIESLADLIRGEQGETP